MAYMFPVLPSSVAKEKSYAYWKGGFTQEDINKIIITCEKIPKVQAITAGADSGAVLEKMRNSTVAWIEPSEQTLWFFEKLTSIIKEVNEQYFDFDLWGLVDNLQYTTYNSEVNGHYDWHIDCVGTGRPQRKLSFVLQLSEPMDYEGGELWVHGVRKEILSKELGIIHFFPSYTLHRITPVTSGRRVSLVGWINGPDFR